MRELREPRAGVAEPLDRDADVLACPPAGLGDAIEREEGPTAGRGIPPERPAEPDRLPGDHRGRIAPRSRVLVVHPRHLARTGVHVGGGDVAVRADHHLNRREVGTTQPLELAHREGLRVDLHAAFGAAERDVEERRLPRHQCREAPELVARRVLVEAEATLEGTPRAVVLDPPPRIHVERAVVPGDPNRDGHLAPVGRQDLPSAVVQADPLGRLVRCDPGPPRTDRRATASSSSSDRWCAPPRERSLPCEPGLHANRSRHADARLPARWQPHLRCA